MKLLRLAFVIALLFGLVAILIYITGVSDLYEINQLTDDDLEALQNLQLLLNWVTVYIPKKVDKGGARRRGFKTVYSLSPLLQVIVGEPEMARPEKDPKTNELEGLSYEFNLCEALTTWEQNYTDHVGKKCTFRLLNRGSVKALDKVMELDESRKEVLIIKTTIHDTMNKMIRIIEILKLVRRLYRLILDSAREGKY